MSGIDQYTKLLLHCDGTDGSTTFTDNSGTGKTVTAVGNAQIDTAQSKFGGASALFDGTGDGLTTPNHADFDFGSGDFTIDFWVRWNSIAPASTLLAKGIAPAVPVMMQSGSDYLFFASSANGTSWGVFLSFNISGILTGGVWYHLAGIRYGNLWSLYLDGVLKASDTVSQTVMQNSNTFAVGNYSNPIDKFNGWIDEFRVSKGIARWTANFTPPISPYSKPSGFMIFLCEAWERHKKLWTPKGLILPEDLGFAI